MANAPYQRMKVANQTSAKNIVKRGSVKTTLNPVEEKSPVGPYAVRFQTEKENISFIHFKPFFSPCFSFWLSLFSSFAEAQYSRSSWKSDLVKSAKKQKKVSLSTCSNAIVLPLICPNKIKWFTWIEKSYGVKCNYRAKFIGSINWITSLQYIRIKTQLPIFIVDLLSRKN